MEEEKKNSYDFWWLRKDMENMGYLFEYCHKYCMQLYGVSIDTEKFLDEFMRSDIRREMETGHPRLLSQSAYDTVKKFIEVDHEGNIEKFKEDKEKRSYRENQLYWVGWMYAYIHYEMDILSRDLIKVLPLELMLEQYYLGHEMDKSVYLKHIRESFK